MAAESSASSRRCPELWGWLLKWTSHLGSYQKRWFVLSNGYLSYYRNQNEMNHSYCGSIFMLGAKVLTEGSNTITVSNGETYRVKTVDEKEKRRWVEALTSASGAFCESQSGNIGNIPLFALHRLKIKPKELREPQAQFPSNDHVLHRTLSAIELFSSLETTITQIREVNEWVAVFRASTSSLINACSGYLDLAHAQTNKWPNLQLTENRKKVWLDNVVAKIIRLNLHDEIFSVIKNPVDTSCASDATDTGTDLSRACVAYKNVLVYQATASGSQKSKSSKEEEGGKPIVDENKESADTPVSEEENRGTPKTTKVQNKKHNTIRKEGKKNQDFSDSKTPQLEQSCSSTAVYIPQRRVEIPERPPGTMSLWSILKNHAGKDISKMPMPIHFSEPLSFLQRLTEDFEHSHILDKASELNDPAEQIAHVACFAVACYSNTPHRTTKPFNPLLGETYECDRVRDFGWKSIAEQVAHHPPISALHCEGKQWTCWLDQSMTTKFQGQNLAFYPSGDVHLTFSNGNHYVWNKVTSSIHNTIVGKLWVDQEGDMIVKCFTNGFTCKVSFLSPGYFGGERHKVKGFVYDEGGDTKVNITGGYDSTLEISRVHKGGMHSKIIQHNEVVWRKKSLKEGSEKYYNFTVFACQLNEMENGVAPTDSRWRPDQRLMENGQWEEAAVKKTELEDLQRAKKTKEEENTHVSVWFQKETDPLTHKSIYVYKGEYWSCKMNKNWSRCPVIFS